MPQLIPLIQEFRQLQALRQNYQNNLRKLELIRSEYIEPPLELQSKLLDCQDQLQQTETRLRALESQITALQPDADLTALAQPPDAALDTPASPAISAGEGKRVACLIGTNAYDDPAFPPLAYPEANVDAFTRVLEDKRLGYFNQVIVLKGKKPNEIVKEIKRLAGQLKVADLLLIYVSGYAVLDKEDGSKLYLIAQNTDPAFLPGSAIDLGWINKTFLDKSEAVQKILILDCQYGGQSPTMPAPDPEMLRTQLQLESKGKYLIGSPLEIGAPATPASAKDAESLLAKYLLEGLTTGKADLDQNGQITAAEWYAYAQRQMRDRGLPEPLQWAPGGAGDWIVARADSTTPQAANLSTGREQNYKFIISNMFREGAIIPFLGSEMVMAAVPASDADAPAAACHEPPLERALAHKLAAQAALPEEARDNPLTVISQYYQSFGARLNFYQQLKQLFPQHVRPGRIHRLLAQQAKPMLVITSSYDTLLEQVFEERQKPYAVVAQVLYAKNKMNLGKMAVQYSDRPERAEIVLSDELSIDLNYYWVFYKIQGTFDLYIKGLGGQEEIDSIVISEEDYFAWFSRLSDQHCAIPNLFYEVFQERPFLFLGYRPCDWNFRTLIRTLRNKPEILAVPGYAVRPQVTAIEQSYWKRLNVEIIASETTDFIASLAEELKIQA